MPSLEDMVPDPAVLAEMDPEELGGILLQVLLSRPKPDEMFNAHNYASSLFGLHREAYPRVYQKDVLLAISEAFCWLEGQALIVPSEGINGQNGFRVVSRRGKRLGTPSNWEAYRQASLLPAGLLHPKIKENVLFNFIRGDYDTAIFVAFKEVEVAVREAAGLSVRDIGVPLMRKAFDKAGGPLADMNAEEGEREALSHLFAGAIGSYKNPHSHRTVIVSDTRDAVEMIVLASHLLRIVDARRTADDEGSKNLVRRERPVAS